MPDCRQIIMSQDYGDFIVEYGGGSEKALERFGNDCLQIINERYYCAYEKLTNIPNFGVAANTYNAIPKLYGLMDTTSVAARFNKTAKSTEAGTDGKRCYCGFY